MAREGRLQRRAEWEATNVWSPNRLRHLRATMVRERFGLEVASCVLGHSGLKVTEVYAERNEKAAADAMRQNRLMRYKSSESGRGVAPCSGRRISWLVTPPD